MKTLFLTLLLATVCATGYGQTIKSLGYNTTNGQIVAATNVVWTNAFSFSTNTAAAEVRTNLSLGATWLTNTNAPDFRNAIGLGDESSVLFDEVLAASADLTAVSVDQIAVYGAISFDGTNAAQSAAATRTNLGLGGGVITNIDVLVSGGGTNTLQFSNGILTNVTTP
jgi:hypothetical protein